MTVISIPERHMKGWGYEDWIVNNKEYCGKILHFEKGKRCSVHYHKKKHETFYLQSGKMKLVLADSPEAYTEGKIEEQTLEVGHLVEIWRGRVHQVIALEESNLFEFSTEHEEEDSYRIIKGD